MRLRYMVGHPVFQRKMFHPLIKRKAMQTVRTTYHRLCLLLYVIAPVAYQHQPWIQLVSILTHIHIHHLFEGLKYRGKTLSSWRNRGQYEFKH